jgi:hypothetical protein
VDVTKQPRKKLKKMKNVREIKVKANQQKRTFTIRTPHAKYRTLPMSQEEFDNAEFWTTNDWEQFLKTDEYYAVR